MDRLRLLALTLVAAVAVAASACGGGTEAVAEKPPPKVAVELVPEKVNEGTFTFAEDEKAREAFSSIGEQALVADGRLFALRHGERLVGTLQLSTMKVKVDLGDSKQRESVINNVIPGAKERIRVGPVSIVQTATEDKTVYLWFGKDLFQVLQLKPTQASPFDPEKVLSDVISYQTQLAIWKPVPERSNGDDA